MSSRKRASPICFFAQDVERYLVRIDFEHSRFRSLLSEASLKNVQVGREPIFTVQKAVELTGLSEHTLRYYERVGLISSVRRDQSSKHRQYSTEDIARLEALSCMRALGMRLADMKAYLAMASQGRKVSRKMLQILERQQARLQERLAETKRYIE